MNSEVNRINKNQQSLKEILNDLSNNIKENNFLNVNKALISIKELINEIIKDNLLSIKDSNENIFKIMNKELLFQLSIFKNIDSIIKDSNILFQTKIILNDILDIIFEEKNFPYICEDILFKECIINCLNIIYLNSKSKIIFFILLKKIDNYIQYIIYNYPSYKDSILNSRNKFKIIHSEIYLYYKNEFETMNIYKLCKSKNIKDKKESISLISNIFNNLKYFSERYEFLIKISKEIFPYLLNLEKSSLSHKKNMNNIDLYILFGKFLLKFLFYHEYIFDFSKFKLNSNQISEKYPCLFLYNINELIDFDELNNKKYRILYKYDIIKEYNKELVDIIVNYFIKPMIIYDTNFDIQLIIFKLLKFLYFICENTNENTKNKFIHYIPDILNNLSFFKKQDEFDIASESREFGYYLLLKDPKFKCVIKSLTNAPKNEIDIYTQKFNIASDLLNNGMYIKEDIKNGKSLEIYEYMNKKFSIIYLEFYVEDNKEITLTIYKRGVEENNFNQIGFNNIIKTVKNENNKENINDEYKIAKIIIINTSSSFNDVDNESSYKNEFKIVFDNFDSWFTNRIIHYSISTFEISD